MSIPQSKEVLQQECREGYQRLYAYIDIFEEEELMATFPVESLYRNVRDVLAHLYHWQSLFLDWYVTGMADKKPEMPSKGHTWHTVPDLNVEIWQMYQGASLQEVRDHLEKTHAQIEGIIAYHNDRELFEHHYYRWTGASTLAAHIRTVTTKHYAWALGLVRSALR